MIRFAMYSRLDQRVFIRSNRITIGGGRVPGVLCAEVTLNEVIARCFTSSKIWKSVPALPGERILILISPGFLTPSEDAMALASQVLGMAARDNLLSTPSTHAASTQPTWNPRNVAVAPLSPRVSKTKTARFP
jgi:predicted proteasome-type protease